MTMGAFARDSRSEIAADPGRSGGVYYAYPYSDDIMPAIPDGYVPTHLSHYGRHGSRWLIKMWEYEEAVASMDSAKAVGGLTPLGEDVARRLHIIADHAKGNAGALSPLGERQHADIAKRMARRFPTLFTEGCHVEAFSSIEPRCIMSMAAFSDALRELYPALPVQRHARPGDMAFINYKSPRSRLISSDDALWWSELAAWRDSVVDSQRLMTTLFTDPTGVTDPLRLMWLLHDVAVDTQDVEPGVELLDIFTIDELYNLWTALNYKMYYQHGNNPETHSAGPACALPLLRHIRDDLYMSLEVPESPSVTLRFGHDTALLRLLALMGVEGADAVSYNPADYAAAWQDYNLAPMAGNLQVVLFTDENGAEPLVLFRHNERPVRLMGRQPINDWYYPLSVMDDIIDTAENFNYISEE